MARSERVFARWRREPDPGSGYAQIPADGVCLSAFLILTDPADPARVLLGTPDPKADWARIGALDARRVALIAGRRMLPSCHLIEYESPKEAAQRIAAEQLGLPQLALGSPEVVSDAYARPNDPGQHWDLDFLVRGTWPRRVPVRAPAWSELELVDPRTLLRARFARAHDDVLRFAGFETGV